MSRSHTRQYHLAKKRDSKRGKRNGWAPNKKTTIDRLQGTLYSAMRQERRGEVS